MEVPEDRFWAKVLFKEFIRHYRKLSNEEIIQDVKQSMDDLEDLNGNSGTFGSKMVQWSFDRKEKPAATASRNNGSLGGRPIKAGMPQSKNIVVNWAIDNGIDPDDAGECWEATKERNWRDADGNAITNWKAFVKAWCKTRKENRK